MRYIKRLLLLIFGLSILLGNYSCRNKKHVKEFYIISTNDSTDFSHSKICYDQSYPSPPPINPKVEIKGINSYFDLVIIFDSIDNVFLYQTDRIINDHSRVKSPRGCVIDEEDKKYYDYLKFPIFLGLRPENLLRFNSNGFIDFVATNNDVFHFNTTSPITRILFLASTKDTIENKAFYDLMNMINKNESVSKRPKDKISVVIRMTTEEENQVLFYKKKNLKYFPEKIKWTKNFLNGMFSPMTHEYDSLEKFCVENIYKARQIIKIDSLKESQMIE